MTILELSFTSAEHQLSVRKFSIDEAISTTFKIAIEAVSPDDDLDLEAIVGKPVMFRMVSGSAWVTSDTRVWTGVVSEMELLRTEPGGLSTYALTLEPTLWLLTQRVNNRLFQHLSVPEIAKKLLDEWKIRVDLRVDETRHPKLELRVQYAENDYAFFCRQLEEAGISFYFEDDGGHGSQLVLTDGPHRNEPRAGGAIRFVDDPSLARAAEHEYLTAVRVGNKVRPGRLTIRDFDFRRPGLSLHSESVVQHDVEGMLEQYHYIPGAFHHEGHQGGETPTADDKGVARAHHTAGQRRADRRLEGHRAGKQAVHFETNALDLSPGAVFSIAGHPRGDLAADTDLLVTTLHLEGEVGKEWIQRGTAHRAALPYSPAAITPKPRIHGVQSAIVVGPEGETVHTDEFGRIRVQFPWDREGHFDHHSSTWIRVSQPWAGPGYGMVNLPRVGHEVLVGFLEGDPDHPVVVGRVFNGAMQVPYKLPESKMISAWKTDSNSNIILFVDIPTHEGFLEQAERDRLSVVKHDEFDLIGNDVTKAIYGQEGNVVGGGYARGVVGEHSTIVGGEYSVMSKSTLSYTSGIDISMTSGFKWEASVTPFLPLVFATLAVGIVRQKVADAFPAGPPDLMAILQQQAADMGWDPSMGMPPGVSIVAALPVSLADDIKKLADDFKNAFKDVLQPILALLSTLTPAQLQAILQLIATAPDLDTILQLLGNVLPPPPPGGTSLGEIMADLKALFAKLFGALPNPQPAPGSKAPIQQKNATEELLNKLKPILKIFSEIMDEMSPGTAIRIMPASVRLTTGKSTIEMKDGDITIKAEGKISIEGASVTISPKPTC